METMKKIEIMMALIIVSMLLVMPVMANLLPSGDDSSITCNGAGAICGNTGDVIDIEENGLYDYDYNTGIIDNSIDNSVDNSVIDNSVDNSVIDNSVDNSVIDNSVDNSVTDNSVDNSVIDNSVDNSIIDNSVDNSVTNNDNSVTTINNDNKVDNSVTNNDNKVDNSVTNTDNSVHTTVVPILKGADGGILISNSNKPPVVTQLDVGVAQVFSRLVYPGETLTYEVKVGDKISMRSSSDVALYTVGWFCEDNLKVSSSDAIPVYSPIYHKFEWGLVVPVDKIDFWTTRATLSAGDDAKYVVIDNRAPRNSYTHIELIITPMPVITPIPVEQSVQ
jgi:hypothetical protein